MADITKIKVNGTEYEIAGSGGEQKPFTLGIEAGSYSGVYVKFDNLPEYSLSWNFHTSPYGDGVKIENGLLGGFITSKIIYVWVDNSNKQSIIRINDVRYDVPSTTTWDNPLKIELTEYPYKIILGGLATGSGGGSND